MSYESVPRWLIEIPEAVTMYPLLLEDVPDHLKTQEMCDDAVSKGPYNLKNVPGHLKTEKMCKKAVEDESETLEYVPNYFKTQKMCDKAMKDDPYSLQFVPDQFVTQQQLDIWYDDEYWYHDDEIIEWYKSYKKRKAQKAKIKEDLLPIAWHPDRVMNWCMSEDVWK